MSPPDNKAAIRHPLYFIPDGDTTIKVYHSSNSLTSVLNVPCRQVEDCIFRIHRYFLVRESKHFRSTFVTSIPCKDPPGSSETNPYVLEDVSSEAFADLLWVFYNQYAILIFDQMTNSFVLKRILNLQCPPGKMEESFDPRSAMGFLPSREALRKGVGENDHAAGRPGREDPDLPRVQY